MKPAMRLQLIAADVAKAEDKAERVAMCARWLCDAIDGRKPKAEINRLSRQLREALQSSE